MGAALVDGFNCSSGESESDSFFEFRHINVLFLEIRIFTLHPRWVELGSASSVGISSTDFGTPFCNWTNLCHIPSNLH